jgi:hypothetical protein
VSRRHRHAHFTSVYVCTDHDTKWDRATWPDLGILARSLPTCLWCFGSFSLSGDRYSCRFDCPVHDLAGVTAPSPVPCTCNCCSSLCFFLLGAWIPFTSEHACSMQELMLVANSVCCSIKSCWLHACERISLQLKMSPHASDNQLA